MKFLKNLFRDETVFCISFICALLSMVAVPPDGEYLSYIDLRTLCLLFCLMAVTAGFQKCGIFRLTAEKLLGAQNHMRGLAVSLVLLPFFCSMIITNDVALLTFVPFTILVLHIIRQDKQIAPIIVLQTAAANLGSMATPPGNPQNLYLCSRYGLGMGEFFSTMLPYAALSLLLLFLCLMKIKKEPIRVYFQESKPIEHRRLLALFAVLFLLCLLTIFRVLPYSFLTICTVMCLALFSRDLFCSVDYFLLLTFICFFVFSGNLGRIPVVQEFLSLLMRRNGLLTSVVSSQVISNVPAAVLLSSFTENWKSLLVGTNLGGLGTPVASLASLISLKFYLRTENASLSAYLLLFLAVNFAGLVILLGVSIFL